jgi:hypothetical protein
MNSLFGLGCTLFLSRVSHKGEFYLDRFLMRQPLHKLLINCYFVNFLVFVSVIALLKLWLSLKYSA